ncbi:MAG: type II toxin-antitoxin system VapC family toxin [Gemmatimonadales bacterium]
MPARSSVFLDTSAWFAALSARDEHHARARQGYEALVEDGGRLVTSNLVVAEVHALLARRLGGPTALRFRDSLYGVAAHEVRHVTRELERAALDRWLRPFQNHRFSLCDAVSFEIMRQERIRTAFALDRHFTVAGFEVVPA